MNKKMLLTVGTSITIVAPIVSVVSCFGKGEEPENTSAWGEAQTFIAGDIPSPEAFKFLDDEDEPTQKAIRPLLNEYLKDVEAVKKANPKEKSQKIKEWFKAKQAFSKILATTIDQNPKIMDAWLKLNEMYNDKVKDKNPKEVNILTLPQDQSSSRISAALSGLFMDLGNTFNLKDLTDAGKDLQDLLPSTFTSIFTIIDAFTKKKTKTADLIAATKKALSTANIVRLTNDLQTFAKALPKLLDVYKLEKVFSIVGKNLAFLYHDKKQLTGILRPVKKFVDNIYAKREDPKVRKTISNLGPLVGDVFTLIPDVLVELQPIFTSSDVLTTANESIKDINKFDAKALVSNQLIASVWTLFASIFDARINPNNKVKNFVSTKSPEIMKFIGSFLSTGLRKKIAQYVPNIVLILTGQVAVENETDKLIKTKFETPGFNDWKAFGKKHSLTMNPNINKFNATLTLGDVFTLKPSDLVELNKIPDLVFDKINTDPTLSANITKIKDAFTDYGTPKLEVVDNEGNSYTPSVTDLPKTRFLFGSGALYKKLGSLPLFNDFFKLKPNLGVTQFYEFRTHTDVYLDSAPLPVTLKIGADTLISLVKANEGIVNQLTKNLVAKESDFNKIVTSARGKELVKMLFAFKEMNAKYYKDIHVLKDSRTTKAFVDSIKLTFGKDIKDYVNKLALNPSIKNQLANVSTHFFETVPTDQTVNTTSSALEIYTNELKKVNSNASKPAIESLPNNPLIKKLLTTYNLDIKDILAAIK